MTPILNIDYPKTVNTIFSQQNTNLNVAKDVPLEDGKLANLFVLAVQHGEGEETNDAVVGSKEIYELVDGVKSLVSTSVYLGSTTHPYGVEVFSDGSVIVKAKTYNSFDDAQNDGTLKVGEVYKCNGFIMYKI